MVPCSRRTAFRRFSTWYRAEDGGTSLEYALLLAIIVGAGLLTIQSLSGPIASSYLVASTALGHGNASSPAARHVTHAPALPVLPTPQPLWGQRVAGQLLPLVVAIAAVGLLVVQRRAARSQSPDAHVRGDGAGGSRDAPPAWLAKRQEILRTMAADVRSLLHNRLVVRNVMSSAVQTIAPTMPTAEVRQFLAERKMRHVLVSSPDRRLQGVISDRDLAVRSGTTAADLMTRDPAVVAPDVSVASAVSIMLQKRISSLPVVEQGVIVGIVTMTDVAMTLQCTLQSLDKVATELEQHGLAQPGATTISGAIRDLQRPVAHAE
jgi:CBS domain-containing protein